MTIKQIIPGSCVCWWIIMSVIWYTPSCGLLLWWRLRWNAWKI